MSIWLNLCNVSGEVHLRVSSVLHVFGLVCFVCTYIRTYIQWSTSSYYHLNLERFRTVAFVKYIRMYQEYVVSTPG